MIRSLSDTARVVCRSEAECAQLADAARESVETMMLSAVFLTRLIVASVVVVRLVQPND